ncbi:TPA: acyl-CoA thioester hydrolase YciA [Vibrio cholerae]|jgi:acyl-CoA thioesterase YciA|nr:MULTISPECIES: acyl-CoA thioester hydrolase YciA [Vibrio]AEA78713.1 Acyl-CoA thioesterase YciA, involved in membrane biogenesis [Vibrio cholerae LMA3984-4]EEY47230.1 acyl-CoA hydrolase [Vibrio cholerae INDRE 91/1]EYC48094.1 acyl-CoA thioester hydrolase [Vibrio cholerae O1 biovar El Tor str. L-3226]KQA26376.1 acyl-CoA thioester hydrolase [Vibrio paracholerae 877-163]MDF4533192.1 acyl-CoA thioester hydrolase YciA [Vibrio parahaemolyticus]MDG6206660.1 acyl-CoA thioester hydrolase YciA [Vibrio 
MNQTVNSPKGQLLLRTLAMPADTNANGDIFGGWIMSQLDLAGGILAKEISCGRIVTVSVSSITFKKPVKVGDVVCCYGECTKIGRTSMSINLEVWVKPVKEEGVGERFQVCEATFNYVAIDANGRPRAISLSNGSQKSS